MAFHNAVIAAVNAGTTIVVAAGNEGTNANDVIPAGYPEVVTVSALTDTDGQPGGNGPSQIYPGLGRFKDDTFAKISNFGADVDVLALGVTILSLKLGGGTTNKLGTSMSAPHVAGVAAMIAANNPGATPAQIRQALINTGECSDGTVYNGAGCSKEWKGDPDDNTSALNEPLVNAQRAAAVVLGTDTTSPAAPTDLTATGGDGSVSLNWADNTDPDLANYNVKCSTTTSGPYTEIATGVGASAYTDNTVTNDTTYFYVVTALDTTGNESGNSNEASSTPEEDTTAPAAPTGLTATGGNGSVGLDWDDNTDTDLTSYNVKRSTTTGGPYTEIATSVADSDYTDNTVNNDTTYFYVVNAVDTTGNESGNSNEASATPAAAATDNMYVGDIVFESRIRGGKNGGKHDERIKITIRRDADGLAESTDAPVSGASLAVELRDSGGSLVASFNGITNGDGTFRTDWITNLANGTYTAEVTALSASGLTWNHNLDVPPDSTDADSYPERDHIIPSLA